MNSRNTILGMFILTISFSSCFLAPDLGQLLEKIKGETSKALTDESEPSSESPGVTSQNDNNTELTESHWKHSSTREMRGYTTSTSANFRIFFLKNEWRYTMEKITSDDLNESDAMVRFFEGQILMSPNRIYLGDPRHVENRTSINIAADELTLSHDHLDEPPIVFTRLAPSPSSNQNLEAGTSSILAKKTNVNIRHSAPNGQIVATVDGGLSFYVSEVKTLENPIYLLRERTHLRRLDGKKPLLKEANHQISQLHDHGDYFTGEVLDDNEKKTTVIIPQELIETKRNAWFKSEDLGGWVYSGLCTALLEEKP